MNLIVRKDLINEYLMMRKDIIYEYLMMRKDIIYEYLMWKDIIDECLMMLRQTYSDNVLDINT